MSALNIKKGSTSHSAYDLRDPNAQGIESHTLAVIVENVGFGAEHAAPIARRVFDYMLLGQYPSEEDLAAVKKGQAAAPIGKPRKVEDMPWKAVQP